MWNNIAPANILTAFSKLVDQMRASNPTMKLLVAKIIPMNPSNCSACGQRAVNLNNAIPGWAASKTTTAHRGRPVDRRQHRHRHGRRRTPQQTPATRRSRPSGSTH
ncbi:hypothetical protein ACFP2T_42915 [Plantactinospora solaniradicis]|uniref:Transposase n=1 Tax=Plantactinospora solaniradicis TaxID=1723736 RepID=A0ABW1KPV8_9ACTN